MRAGFYLPGSPNPVAPSVGGLAARLQLGLIRLNGSQSPDQLTEIISAMVRSIPSGAVDELTLDYKLESDSEDYNVAIGSEDFGTDAINYVNHRLRLVATNDGRTEAASVEPDLVRFDPAARYYSCSITGVWHIVEMAAVEPGESFKLHSLELTVIDAGRLL